MFPTARYQSIVQQTRVAVRAFTRFAEKEEPMKPLTDSLAVGKNRAMLCPSDPVVRNKDQKPFHVRTDCL